MQEAKKIEGIQNYPFIFIETNKICKNIHDYYDRKEKVVKDIFDQDNNVIPIVSIGQTGFLNSDILLAVQKDDTGYLPTEVLGLIDRRRDGYYNISGKSIATREDEYVIFVYRFTQEYRTDFHMPVMGYSLITNYGNIISGTPYNISGCMITNKTIIQENPIIGNSYFINFSGRQQDNRDCQPNMYSVEFIKEDLPQKQCYVPQVFIDVITIFLKHAELSQPIYGNDVFINTRRELVQKFKEICYKFTQGGNTDKSKDEEIERLKSLLQERDREIERKNRVLTGYENIIDDNTEEISQLENELKNTRLNINKLREKMSITLAKKGACTNIYRQCYIETLKLRDEIANLESILEVHNIY